jgi:hypothetical protein
MQESLAGIVGGAGIRTLQDHPEERFLVALQSRKQVEGGIAEAIALFEIERGWLG